MSLADKGGMFSSSISSSFQQWIVSPHAPINTTNQFVYFITGLQNAAYEHIHKQIKNNQNVEIPIKSYLNQEE